MTVEQADSPARPGVFERSMILVTVTSVTMLYAMTVTIANVSLPQMQGALSATTDQIALVVTFNIIATAIATPIPQHVAGHQRRDPVVEEEEHHDDGGREQRRGDGPRGHGAHPRGGRRPESDRLPGVLDGGEPGRDARRRR